MGAGVEAAACPRCRAMRRLRRVAIPEVEPYRPVAAEDAPDLAEDLDDRRDVRLGRRLEAELAVDAAGAALAADRQERPIRLGVLVVRLAVPVVVDVGPGRLRRPLVVARRSAANRAA